MTETLGWGDVDVDEAPRRRRRLPAVALWTAVVAVVAAVGLWPTAKGDLAGRAAAWLQRQWQVAGSYESSRTNIELGASQRVAADDSALLVRIVQELDREEAGKLSALADAVSHHRLWARDIERTGKSVREAFLAEAHDLRADVKVASQEVPLSTSVESPYSFTTEVAIHHAGDQVQAMASARHLKLDKRVTPSLSSAATDLAALQRVTAAPVNLRMAVLHDGQLDVWDLRTGHVRSNIIKNVPVDAPNQLTAVGSSLLVQFDSNWQLWPTSGTQATTLPTDSPDAFYQPDGDGGMWRTEGARIRHYDATGRPHGPWYRYPPSTEVGAIGATRDAIVSNLGAVNFNDAHPVLWYPATGRIAPFADPCPGVFQVAHQIVGYTSCDMRSVYLLDTSTGRTKTVRLPAGFSLTGTQPVLSQDGSRIAMLAAPRNSDARVSSLYVFDVRTGAITEVPTAAMPLAWSPDGSVLLLDMNGDGLSPTTVTTTGSSPLAYWQPGMRVPAGIRLALNDGAFSVALLP